MTSPAQRLREVFLRAPTPVEPPRAAPAPAPLVRRGRDPDRYELKFWVPEALTAEVTAYARSYLELDPFAARTGQSGQWNTSLYLDTLDFHCFHRHVDDAPDRFKLRIRAYGDPPSGPAFFETKRKVKGVIVKTRTAVPMAAMRPLLDGSYDALPVLGAEARQNLEGFLYLHHLHATVPVVMTRCHREAFGSADPIEDVRLTIDRVITGQRAHGYGFDADPGDWTPIDGWEQHGRHGPHAMVELKFPRIAPPWMRALVRRLEMWRVGYSKYVSSVQTMFEEPQRDQLDWACVETGNL